MNKQQLDKIIQKSAAKTIEQLKTADAKKELERQILIRAREKRRILNSMSPGLKRRLLTHLERKHNGQA